MIENQNILFGFAILIAIALIIYWSRKRPTEPLTVLEPNIPKPVTPPTSAPTWSSRGEWAIPFAVRYAVTFSNDGEREGPMSDWSPYYRSSQFSNPILSRFPVTLQQKNRPHITHIKIYRQFEGHQPIFLDTVRYPYLARYTDRSADDF